MNSSKIGNAKKIAVLRGGALGDVIVTLPALQALRCAYPEAEIVLLGRSWAQEYFSPGRSVIDRVVPIPVYKGIREEKHGPENRDVTERFFEQMQEERFDVAINMQGNGISANPFVRRLGARFTAGLRCKDAVPLDRNLDFYYYQNELIRYLEVVRLIGAEVLDLEPRVNVLRRDEDEVKDLLLQTGKKPFVVLHPCAVDPRRMWPLENYAPLADILKRRNYEMVLTGGPADIGAVQEILSRIKGGAIDSCGRLTLGGLTALLSRAALVIGADTGPLHLARAVHTPTVSIHWAPNLINWGPVTRSIHHPVISWEMHCPLCGTVPNDPYPFQPVTGCTHAVSFVRDITVEQVMEAAEGLLSKTDGAMQYRQQNPEMDNGTIRPVVTETGTNS